MIRYSLGRLLSAIPTLILVVFIAFAMVRAAPGGPFDSERVLPPAVEQNIEKVYKLDQPMWRQFAGYLGGLVQGDFGPSYRYQDVSVNEIIGDAFPVSVRLGVLAIAVALIVGIAIGTMAALKKNTAVDRMLMLLAMAGLSIPIFVVAPILVLLFAVKLGWLPAGWDGSYSVRNLALPVISLALPQIAFVAKITRASMIEVLGSDYVRTARAQGIGTYNIIRYHALKPAMLPVVSYLGPATAAILTGSVIIEEVFGIPGLGQHFVRSALNRDYTLVLGIVVFYATLIIVLNLVVDILYGVIDPRIRRA